MPSAVLVVDMLRGFVEEGNPLYCGPPARRIIPNIQRLLEKELAQGAKVFFIADSHDPDDLEFRMFPPHCIEGTPESEVIPELASYPGERIPKKRYSAFFGTDLEASLKALGPERLIVCGVCTDICVLHTVADACNRDYAVEVPRDGVASFDPKAHHSALEHMERVLGARVTAISEEAPPRFVTDPSIITGDTSDIYFLRTVEVLKKEGVNPVATMEIFPSREGILCGIEEVKALLREVLPEGSQVWALDEGRPSTRRRWCYVSPPPTRATASMRQPCWASWPSRAAGPPPPGSAPRPPRASRSSASGPAMCTPWWRGGWSMPPSRAGPPAAPASRERGWRGWSPGAPCPTPSSSAWAIPPRQHSPSISICPPRCPASPWWTPS